MVPLKPCSRTKAAYQYDNWFITFAVPIVNAVIIDVSYLGNQIRLFKFIGNYPVCDFEGIAGGNEKKQESVREKSM